MHCQEAQNEMSLYDQLPTTRSVIQNNIQVIFVTFKLFFLPAAAMCSLVLIGWNPTKGICIDNIKPTIKKVLYAVNEKTAGANYYGEMIKTTLIKNKA